MEDEKKESKPRCRVKNILNKALELLDFYFSDVNLNHDRFLRKEIEKDPQGFVTLSTMLKFNKLNDVTSDVKLLAKAVENSSSLELNADSTLVRRKEKLKEIENVDPKTVYVEDFPANTNIDHDWLRSVFSCYGDVTYISLPKYSHNNQPKGFAFIEYSSVKDARKACQVLNSNHKKRDKKRRSASESEGHSLLRQNSKRRRSVSESSEGSINVSRRKRKSSSCSGCSTEGNTDITKGENIELSQNKSELTPLVEEQTGDKTSSSDEGGKRVTIVESVITLHENEPTLPLPLPSKNEKDLDETTLSKDSSNSEEKNQKEPVKAANEEVLQKQTARKRKSSISLESEDKKVKSATYEKPCEEGSTDEISSKQHDDDHHDKGRADKRKISETETETEKVEEKKAKTHSPVMSECLATPASEKDEHRAREGGKKGKKNRQHKKKKKEKNPDIPKIPSLHVILKTEWVSLKKEYKRLQHIKVSELKRNMKVLKIEQVRRKELDEKISKTMTTKSEPKEQVVGEREKEKENLESPLTESKLGSGIVMNQSKGLDLSTGTVVALKTSSLSLTRSEIKTTLSMYANVAYVDYVDGVFQGFVRFASNADLEKIMALDEKERAYFAFQLRKLTDEEEKEYFLRAEEKRLKKYDKTQKKKRKKQRGIDKVNDSVDRISSHVHFS